MFVNIKFIPVKTKIISPPQDDIYPVFDKYLTRLKEKDIVFITSKIVAIHQGRTVLKTEVIKDKLIKEEADILIGSNKSKEAFLTIKNNTFIPQAGIDESNGGDYYILWPNDPSAQAKEICEYLKKKFKRKLLGVVITDSHLMPFRWGTSGISIGFYGIDPLRDYRGKKDIFGRKMQMTQVNIVDSISAIAVLHMGEGSKKAPIVIARGLDFVKFINKEKYKDFMIPKEEDVFGSII